MGDVERVVSVTPMLFDRTVVGSAHDRPGFRRPHHDEEGQDSPENAEDKVELHNSDEEGASANLKLESAPSATTEIHLDLTA